jgi:hypothetical protein
MKSFHEEKNIKESKALDSKWQAQASPQQLSSTLFLHSSLLFIPHLNGFKKKSDSQLST